MTKARDTANIVGGGFSGTIAGATMEPTGDTAAGDNAAMGFTAAEGLILTGQGSTNDVTIKNDADADVIEIPTGTVNVTMAGTLGVTGVITGGGVTVGNAVLSEAELEILDGATVTTGELNLIDGGTARGTTAIADGDGVLVNDAGTMRMTTVDTLATYVGTKIAGAGLVYLASSGAISDGTASVVFTQFDASKYDHYQFMFQHVVLATDAEDLIAQASTDGGSNYDSTSGNYHNNGAGNRAGFVVAGLIGNDTNEFGVSGEFKILAPHNTSYTYTTTFAALMTDATNIKMGDPGDSQSSNNSFSSMHLVAADVDAIKFVSTSGNFESGEIVMYGIANGT